MGKGQSPTANELKFIYELLAQGYSDTDIFVKYEELDKHGKLGSLPNRQDIRFMRQRRKEFETCRAVVLSQVNMKQEPLVIGARKKHFEALCEVIRNWTKQIYYADDEEAILPYFPTAFKPSDTNPGYHRKGALEWVVGADGTVIVSFEMERHFLFDSLRTHLPSEKLWATYEELKSWLTKGIQQASEQNRVVEVHERVSPLKKRLREEIETLLARRVFPGKCKMCPDYEMGERNS